jgi:predicted PhzF superfamily epimerase YddE/YHI9
LGLKATQILAAQLLDNGPVWLGLLLDSPDTVLALDPDHARLKELGQKVGVASFNRSQDAIQVDRTFQPGGPGFCRPRRAGQALSPIWWCVPSPRRSA